MSRLIITVDLDDTKQMELRRHFAREHAREELGCILETIADDYETSAPIAATLGLTAPTPEQCAQRAAYIRNNLEDLIEMYWKDMADWENMALSYAADNGQGVRNHLEDALDADKTWEAADNGYTQ